MPKNIEERIIEETAKSLLSKGFLTTEELKTSRELLLKHSQELTDLLNDEIEGLEDVFKNG